MRNRRLAVSAFSALAVMALAACGPAEDRPLDAPKPGTLQPADRPLEPQGAPTVGAWMVLDGRTVPVRYLCDGLDRPQLIAVLEPDARGGVSVAVFRKAAFDPPEVAAYTLGPDDPGAGQIYQALNRGGAAAGHVRRFDPGVLDDPAAATLPTLTEIKIGDEVTRCRWLPNVRFLGFTAQRSVVVSRAASGALAYASHDFKTASRAAMVQAGALQSTTPSLAVEDGEEAAAQAPQTIAFARDGYGYRIRIGGSAADLSVTLGGAPIATEPFVGWIYAGR